MKKMTTNRQEGQSSAAVLPPAVEQPEEFVRNQQRARCLRVIQQSYLNFEQTVSQRHRVRALQITQATLVWHIY